MAIEYFDGTNYDGLFDILGKYVHALDTLNTARGTTVPAEVLDAVQQYKLKTDATLDMDRAIAGLDVAEAQWVSGGSVLANALRTSAINFLVEVCRADSDNDIPGLTEALVYLIDAMTADEYYVDDNTISTPTAADGGNSSTDLSIAATYYNGDVYKQQNILAEVISLEFLESGDSSLAAVGETAVSDALSDGWPAGSGIATSVRIETGASNLVANGGFETASDDDDTLPANWIFGSDPTGIRLTVHTTQTVIISGTPTSGFYHLKYTHPVTGYVYSTVALNYDSSQADVQAALRALPDLGSVEVTTTGTGPNYTHTILFEGVAGQVSALSSLEYFDSGSIAHAVTVTGDAGAVKGKGLYLPSTAGAHTIYIPINPVRRALHGLHLHYYQASGSATIAISIVDGIGGSDIVGESGGGFAVSTNLSSGGDNHLKSWFACSGDTTLPIYLKITVTANSAALVLDDVMVVPTQVIYPGGPTIMAYRGRVDPAPGDKWTVTPANDRASLWQQAFDRLYDMRNKRLLLPTSGSTLVNDSLIG